MRRQNVFLLGFLVLALPFAAPTANAVDITSIDELLSIPDMGESDIYVLQNDLTFTGDELGGNPYYISALNGVLDGNGFTINGLRKTLINEVRDDSTVKDLELIASSTIEGRGTLANNVLSNATIENVHASGDVTYSAMSDVGGLIGYMGESGLVTNSSFSGSVNGNGLDNVGGLIGRMDSVGEVNNSSFSGTVESDAGPGEEGSANVGGLIGSSLSDVVDSTVTGDVTGNNSVGGLVGYSQGNISGATITGDVTGNDTVGGLTGTAISNISDSTFSGNVTGERYVGGLAGVTSSQTISNSSASGNVTGNVVNGEGNIGGLVGGGSGSISDSHANVNVTGAVGNQAIGGLLGYGDVSVKITNSYSTGTVTGDAKVGGLVGQIAGSYIEKSYSTGDVIGRTNGSIGGLAGFVDRGSYWGTVRGISSSGSYLSSLIESSYATGDVTQIDTGNDGGGVGGLVGQLASGTILNSYSTGNVLGETTVGGLVGRVLQFGQNSGLTFGAEPYINYYGLIENSYSTSTINQGSPGANRLGGLVGILNGGKIVNSYATAGGIGIDGGCDHIGGLVGDGSGFGGLGSNGIIQDSFAYIEGNLTAGCGLVGGLAGSMGDGSSIINSFAYVSGTISGGSQVGGLVGSLGNFDDISDSNALVAADPSLSAILAGDYLSSGPVYFSMEQQAIGLPTLPSIVSVVNTDYETAPYATNSCLNSGLPYLIAIASSYTNSCDDDPIVVFSRNYLLNASRTLNKALLEFGFKSNFSSHPNLGFQALEQNQSNSPAVIQLFEVSEYQNSNILLSKEDGLQLSISSSYKEPVEIWTQGSKGEYLYLGLVEFDKDGKAILPTLKFDNANTYQILMIKAADKLSQKPNLDAQLGQITINVI